MLKINPNRYSYWTVYPRDEKDMEMLDTIKKDRGIVSTSSMFRQLLVEEYKKCEKKK